MKLPPLALASCAMAAEPIGILVTSAIEAGAGTP